MAENNEISKLKDKCHTLELNAQRENAKILAQMQNIQSEIQLIKKEMDKPSFWSDAYEKFIKIPALVSAVAFVLYAVVKFNDVAEVIKEDDLVQKVED